MRRHQVSIDIRTVAEHAARRRGDTASGGDAAGDTLTNIQNLVGSAGADPLTGDALANIFRGGGGADRILTSVSYVLGAGQEIETLRTADDQGTGAIDLTGNAFANKLVGNDGLNILSGGGGADSLFGRGGADTFLFATLADSTVAGAGRDTRQDFGRPQGDRIDLHLIDALAGGTVNQAFRFIGDKDFTDRAGELHAVASGANTPVGGDVGGDGAADFAILLKGALTLHSGSFVL